MKATRPGAGEIEIAAAARGAFIAGGAFYEGYAAIVGAGGNSLILHYDHLTETADGGELVLTDFGPDYKYYCADITRTWPASGKFSERQRKVYLDCLKIQELIIAAVKPGATVGQLSALNASLMKEMGYEKCFRHGPR